MDIVQQANGRGCCGSYNAVVVMKATPGPWTHGLQLLSDGVDDNGNYINQRSVTDYYSIKAGEGFWRAEDNTQGFCITGYMAESNARLLASAPDLLEAMERMMVSLNKSSCGWNTDSDIESAYQLCKAAFKKAKGI